MPNSKNNGEFLINKLLEETFRPDPVPEKGGQLSLHDYFEQRQNDVENIDELFSISLYLIKEISCLRWIEGKDVIDFPINWSYFKNTEQQIILPSNDRDELLNVINSYLGENYAALVIKKIGLVEWKLYFAKEDEMKIIQKESIEDKNAA